MIKLLIYILFILIIPIRESIDTTFKERDIKLIEDLFAKKVELLKNDTIFVLNDVTAASSLQYFLDHHENINHETQHCGRYKNGITHYIVIYKTFDDVSVMNMGVENTYRFYFEIRTKKK